MKTKKSSRSDDGSSVKKNKKDKKKSKKSKASKKAKQTSSGTSSISSASRKSETKKAKKRPAWAARMKEVDEGQTLVVNEVTYNNCCLALALGRAVAGADATREETQGWASAWLTGLPLRDRIQKNEAEFGEALSSMTIWRSSSGPMIAPSSSWWLRTLPPHEFGRAAPRAGTRCAPMCCTISRPCSQRKAQCARCCPSCLQLRCSPMSVLQAWVLCSNCLLKEFESVACVVSHSGFGMELAKKQHGK